MAATATPSATAPRDRCFQLKCLLACIPIFLLCLDRPVRPVGQQETPGPLRSGNRAVTAWLWQPIPLASGAGRRPMEFRILGPLEVRDGEEPVAIGGGRQRALLALLLLRPNEVVSNDTLIDELWHGEPTETARKAIQVHVSSLRKALGEDRIVTQAPGYRLRVNPGELDL